MNLGPTTGNSFKYGRLASVGKAGLTILALAAPATAEDLSIVAFGDSLTQGYGLIEQDGFVPQMRDWLEANGISVRLVNAGVSGDTTAGGAARIGWTLTPELDAMILTLGGNDMLRGIDPAVSRKNLELILETARQEEVDVLLVGMSAPGNYGADYKAEFDEIYPDLAEKFGTLYATDFFAGLEEQDPAKLVPFMQPDGIHPNRDGVARIVAHLGPFVLELIDRAEGN